VIAITMKTVDVDVIRKVIVLVNGRQAGESTF
jgi:hypothetical protein